MSTPTASAQTEEPRAGAERDGGGLPSGPGVLASQHLRRAVADGWVSSRPYQIEPEAFQPASLDLRLGHHALALRCSFLPGAESTVEEKADDLVLQKIDLRDGALLERGRPYLIPLAEELRLPPGIRGKTNPKSSTGRLDVFTRVITDRNHRFDEIPDGYQGRLYLEVVPQSFAVLVESLLALNQIRLVAGRAQLDDADLRAEDPPLLYDDSRGLRGSELPVADGLFLGVGLMAPDGKPVGYSAKKNSHVVDLRRIRAYHWSDYWEPVYPEAGGRVVLEPETFYLLLSRGAVCIPPHLAAEMAAYDPTAGELRTHYAGFFDPGFGFDPAGRAHGSRAALEVRARDVAFRIEHGQPVCKLVFERMAESPDVLYGEGLASNYQGQTSMLSKHFADQTAGLAGAPESGRAPVDPADVQA